MSDRSINFGVTGPPKPPILIRIARSRLTYVIGFLGLVGMSVVWMMPSDQEEKKGPEPSVPGANVAVYQGPKIIPTPAAQQQQEQKQQQKQEQQAEPKAEVFPPIKLGSVSFSNGSFVPEYLKPAKAAAEAETQKIVGKINYKESNVDAIHSMTIKDRTYELPAFSKIPCILEWRIVTGSSGVTPFRCHVKGPVLSPGRVTLLEDGTTIGGFYRSLVKQGESRIDMVTAQSETPYGVIVKFEDPIGDPLGGAGAPGSVDNHWGPRIGGALLLAASDAAVQITEAALQSLGSSNNNSNNRNTNFNFNGGTNLSALQQVTQALLAQTINQPPTITLNQGDEISLLTTKMIDFSPSYQVDLKR
jgi:type IV secretion system protein VirB10